MTAQKSLSTRHGVFDGAIYEVTFPEPVGDVVSLIVGATDTGGLARQLSSFYFHNLPVDSADGARLFVSLGRPNRAGDRAGAVYRHMRRVATFTVKATIPPPAPRIRPAVVPSWGKPARDRVRLGRAS